MIAMTATADKQTRADIIYRLQLQTAEQHIASFDRPNIHYTIIEKHKPKQQLIQFLNVHQNQSGIIYCTTRKRVEEVANHLQSSGFNALPYHAGLSNIERSKAQTAFQRDDIQIIVATVAFGMGIDKPNVRFVMHYDISKNIEAYYQETGRAGRDSMPAEALMLYGTGDIAKVRGMLEQTDNEQQKRIEIHKLNAMAAFAEAQSCRRRVLLNYFGEELPEDCGNCDTCLNPPETYDATVEAQKALSCVYRVKQKFGLTHVIDILRGADTERIRNWYHHELSTYGIGKEHNQVEWATIFRQLIHKGYLEQDIANYSVLKLTEKARPLLRGEEKLQLAKTRIKLAPATSSKKAKASKKKLNIDYDINMFEKLRKLRKQIADRDGVPPFIVFSDTSLAEMAAYKPTNAQAFLAINGVGQRKLVSYGDEFIELIGSYE